MVPIDRLPFMGLMSALVALTFCFQTSNDDLVESSQTATISRTPVVFTMPQDGFSFPSNSAQPQDQPAKPRRTAFDWLKRNRSKQAPARPADFEQYRTPFPQVDRTSGDQSAYDPSLPTAQATHRYEVANLKSNRGPSSIDHDPTTKDATKTDSTKQAARFELTDELRQAIANLSPEELEELQSLPPGCVAELPGVEPHPNEVYPHGNLQTPEHLKKRLATRQSNQFAPRSEDVRLVSGDATDVVKNVLKASESALGENYRDQARVANRSLGQMPNPHAAASAKGTKPVNPNPGEDPHFQVYSRDAYPSATECAQCHKQIYEEWSSSSHAYASVSPMFHVFENTINRLAQGTLGYFCLRCHAPVATTMGLRRDQPIWDGPQVFREGVTCVACHRVNTHYTKVNGERRMTPGDINSPIVGTGEGTGVELALKYKEHFKVKDNSADKEPGLLIHRQAIQFEEMGKSEYCMSCHQVAVQPGIKLEVVWDQYRASPAYRDGVTCQDCHMGKVPGVAAGYSVGPAAIVNDKVVNPERRHSNHMFYGPGYSIAHPGIFPHNLKAKRWTFNEWLEFDWRAGWGLEEFEDALDEGQIATSFPPTWSDVDDRMDAREIIEENLKKLRYKKDIRRQVLENGSKLDGPFFADTPRAGKPLKFNYCVTNLNSGHNMPSGSLGAQPQIWMNAVLIGPSGQRLWETGYVDSNGDLADNHSLDVLARRVPFDTQLFNLQTKFLTTNVKGTDREMYLPINVDFDQLPFIRPAAQPVTVINHPPFIRMEGHSIPPLGSRKAKFVVPSRLMKQPGVYRLSVRMRSRAEPIYFMRFCDASPEMERMMNEWIADFHVSSSTFEVK